MVRQGVLTLLQMRKGEAEVSDHIEHGMADRVQDRGLRLNFRTKRVKVHVGFTGFVGFYFTRLRFSIRAVPQPRYWPKASSVYPYRPVRFDVGGVVPIGSDDVRSFIARVRKSIQSFAKVG